MTIGLVGAGMIGRTHVESIRHDGRAQVSWVCSRRRESADALQTEYNIPHGTTELEELLSDNSVEAVVVASPPHVHREQALAVLAAGKHLLIEKPLAPTREDTRAIAEAAAASDRVALSCSCRHTRLQPKFAYVRGLLESGAIGKLYHIHHTTLRTAKRYGVEYNPDAAWGRSRATAGGGPLVDWGVYDLSFHLGLLRDGPSIESSSHFSVRGLDDKGAQLPDFDVEEHGALHMRLSGGLSYYYERSSNAHFAAANETRLFGSRGALIFDYHSWGTPEIRRYRREERAKEPALTSYTVDMREHTGDHQALITHFIDCCRGEVEPAMTPQTEAKHLETLFGVVEETRVLSR